MNQCIANEMPVCACAAAEKNGMRARPVCAPTRGVPHRIGAGWPRASACAAELARDHAQSRGRVAGTRVLALIQGTASAVNLAVRRDLCGLEKRRGRRSLVADKNRRARFAQRAFARARRTQNTRFSNRLMCVEALRAKKKQTNRRAPVAH